MIWKEIPNHPDYEASTSGKIRSKSRIEWATRTDGSKRKRTLTGKILKPYLSGGYWCVSIRAKKDLRSKPRAIHILVLTTFKRKTNKYACHKDDNRNNNRLNNLYWGSAKHNAQDRVKNNKIRLKRLSMSQIYKYLVAYHVKEIPINKIIKHSGHSRSNVRNFLYGKTHVDAFNIFKKNHPLLKLKKQPKLGRGLFTKSDIKQIKVMHKTMSIGLIAEKKKCSWGTIKNVVSGVYDNWV